MQLTTTKVFLFNALIFTLYGQASSSPAEEWEAWAKIHNVPAKHLRRIQNAMEAENLGIAMQQSKNHPKEKELTKQEASRYRFYRRTPFYQELAQFTRSLSERFAAEKQELIEQQEEERAHFSAQAASMAEEIAALKFQLAKAQQESTIFRSLYEQQQGGNADGASPSESGTQRPRSPSAMSEGAFSFVTEGGRVMTSEDEEQTLTPRRSRTPTPTSGLENNEV